MRFYQVEPTLENYWRGIILFGKNVASYKFALAHSLYDIKPNGSDLILLEDLAVPFSNHLCRHIQHTPKQITSRSSQFIVACSQFSAGEITRDGLTSATIRQGFNNVIDAFHNINQGEIEKRFFIDERKTHKGIRLTENFYCLGESQQYKNLNFETDARWRLIEQAWAMNIASQLISIEYDDSTQVLFSRNNERRVDISSCRDSLNGYQKGRCFYCFASIRLTPTDEHFADVDHFIPWKARKQVRNVDGVWNLVLACKECNRGEKGKFARQPSRKLLQRLSDRNEYFINSHRPLRETLIRQTGAVARQREVFLNTSWNDALQILFHQWEPIAQGMDTF